MEALGHAVRMLGLVFGFMQPLLLGHYCLRAKKKFLMGNPAMSVVVLLTCCIEIVAPKNRFFLFFLDTAPTNMIITASTRTLQFDGWFD
jgi:hypothetical protein